MRSTALPATTALPGAHTPTQSAVGISGRQASHGSCSIGLEPAAAALRPLFLIDLGVGVEPAQAQAMTAVKDLLSHFGRLVSTSSVDVDPSADQPTSSRWLPTAVAQLRLGERRALGHRAEQKSLITTAGVDNPHRSRK